VELSVTVLGCSGSYPGPGGACSGYLIDAGDTRLWVDAGSGTLANLQQHVPDVALDAVFLSHEHPDHWTDIEGYLNVLRFVTGATGVPVYSPAGLRERPYQAVEPYLDWHDVSDGDRVTVGSIDVSFSRTDHARDTLAMRFDRAEGGPSVVYSADTGPGWSVEAFGEGIDLALVEATIPPDKEGEMQHLSARQAGESARAAGAARLVLTHLWPTLDAERSRSEGSEAFGAEVEVATVHRRYEVMVGTA
jgi:ribonuclease BN (tRNA processing enzyme)